MTITGAILRNAVIYAAQLITSHRQEIDALNVFPVPDGDTGTNMSMTITNASREVRVKDDSESISAVASRVASGLLRGARGNSGVILSLLFRGFSKSLKGKLEADGKDFAAALTAGVEAAYKAVMKPAEGTILTVSRLTADAARDLAAGERIRAEDILLGGHGDHDGNVDRAPELHALLGLRREQATLAQVAADEAAVGGLGRRGIAL